MMWGKLLNEIALHCGNKNLNALISIWIGYKYLLNTYAQLELKCSETSQLISQKWNILWNKNKDQRSYNESVPIKNSCEGNNLFMKLRKSLEYYTKFTSNQSHVIKLLYILWRAPPLFLILPSYEWHFVV